MERDQPRVTTIPINGPYAFPYVLQFPYQAVSVSITNNSGQTLYVGGSDTQIDQSNAMFVVPPRMVYQIHALYSDRIFLTASGALVAFEYVNVQAYDRQAFLSSTLLQPLTGAFVTPADGTVNTTGVADTSFLMVWNGVTWDRWREVPTADGVTRTGIGSTGPMVFDPNTAQWSRLAAAWNDGIADDGKPGVLPMVWNGATWDRLREANSDTLSATGLLGAGVMVFNGATWDRGKPALADSQAGNGWLGVTPTVYDPATGVWNRLQSAWGDGVVDDGKPAALAMVFNGGSWDRLTAIGADNVGPNGKPAVTPMIFDPVTGLWSRMATAYADALVDDGKPGVLPLLYNGSGWDRMRSAPVNGSGLLLGIMPAGLMVWDPVNSRYLPNISANQDGSQGFYVQMSGTSAFNGTTYDRLGSASAVNVGAQSGLRSALVSAPGNWSLLDNKGAGVQATATRAAAAGIRHVLTTIVASLSQPGAPTGGAIADLVVRDGATGVGAIIFQARMDIANIANAVDRLVITGLSLPGSVNTAMTVEFLAGAGAAIFQGISAHGYEAP